MLKAFSTLALLALAVSTAHAADLITDPPPDERVNLVSDPAWGLYLQGYGGIVTQSLLLGVDHFNFGDEPFFDLLNTGPAFGGPLA